MRRKGSKQPYKPRVEYKYTIKDIADLAGTTRNALNVGKVRGKVDPGDFKSVVSFLIKRIIDNCLRGNLFASARRPTKRGRGSRTRTQVGRRRHRKAGGRK